MTKIFICDLQNTKFNEEQLKKYLLKSEIYDYMYSADGIFKIVNNNIYKLKLHDSNFIKKNIKNIDLLFDNSRYDLEENYHLPSDNNILNIQAHIYSLRNKSNLKLFIEKDKNNHIYDIYFSYDKLDDYNLNEDINTFLTMVN
jgi:hypothetical protein